MPTARTISYLLFAALIVAACVLHLGPVLLAGLFSYMLLDLTHRHLAGRMPDLLARWISVAIFLVTASALAYLFGQFVRLAIYRIPLIATSVLPTIDQLATDYGIDWPYDTMQQLRGALIAAVRDNARSITAESGLLTRGFFQIVIGLFIAIAKFLPDKQVERRASLFDDLTEEFSARVSLFMHSYEKVLGAQVLISAINTVITIVFVILAGIPYVYFLTLATFILGIVPLIGNVLANAIIIGAALTQSPQRAFAAFLFLIISHKLQYLLSGRILGSTLKTPMWATLFGILVGEVLLGVPGIIIAPAVLHYAREELAAIPSSRG
jgi:predicted PurR-regulated permease PerM